MSQKTPTVSPRSEESDEIDISRILNILLINKSWIGLSLLTGLLLGALYAFSASPVYQANALLQIEPKDKNQILGDLKGLTGLGGDNGDAKTEIQILRSRLVLGSTVDTLSLTAQPEYQAPFFLTSWLQGKRAATPSMTVTQFIIPAEHLGKKFHLTATAKDKFDIETPFGKTYKATAGELLTTPEGFTAILSGNNLLAGDKFLIVPVSRQTAIANLAAAMGAQENGAKTNILGLTMNDSQPKDAENTLNTVVDYYVKQNKEYDAQVAASSLGFIDQQLPKIKESLEKAENSLNAYRNRNSTVDIAIESKGVVESLNQIEMQLTDIKIKESEVVQLYTPDHPVYKAIAEKKAVLEKAKKQLLAKIGNLPTTQQEVIRLKRDVDIQQAIYQQLLQKQQELNITQASKLGNIRVIDRALALEKPIKPQKPLIVAAAGLGAGLLTTLFFILRSLFRRGIDEAENLESIGVPVLASVPFSEIQRKRDVVLKYLKRKNKHARSNFLLAANKPDDIAVEALRALRTSLLLQSMESGSNVLMITGATPAVGKTFVSANLATVMAQAGKRVLLVDADLRKGYVHELFNMDMGSGLSEYLTASSAPAALPIQTTPVNQLDFISHGIPSANPAEILSLPRFGELLKQLAAAYDFVIVDAPPALAVTDANIIGQHAGMTLIVTRFEETTIKDVEATISRLRNNNIEVSGAILNGIQRSASNYHTYEAYTRYAQK